uniref:RNase H type-1 domain-containing protein n=1 Tax=Noccaea caerulescens TaxID=107243 RepID=A0A1J3DDY9_NOCCA
MTEALAIRSALNHALEEGFTSLHLKSDARDLIRALNSQEKIKEIYGLLFDIHALASMFSSIEFSFIPRSGNSQFLSIVGLYGRISQGPDLRRKEDWGSGKSRASMTPFLQKSCGRLLPVMIMSST